MRVRVTGLDALARVVSDLEAQPAKNRARAEWFVVALRGNLEEKLLALLGEKMDHFDVELDPGGMVNVITVSTSDEVGNYIYYGTGPHTIQAQDPMPIGNNQFAYRVQHPGTDSHEIEIDEAIRTAYLETATVMGDGLTHNL